MVTSPRSFKRKGKQRASSVDPLALLKGSGKGRASGNDQALLKWKGQGRANSDHPLALSEGVAQFTSISVRCCQRNVCKLKQYLYQ